MRIGAPRAPADEVLDRSSSVGSAQWRSSNTSTSGRARSDRLEQPAQRPERLLGARRAPSSPIVPHDALADELRLLARREQLRDLRARLVGRVVREIRGGSTTISVIGQNVMPSP